MKKRTRNLLIFSIILFFILLWSVLLYYVSPSEIVNSIGVENTYAVLFLIATFGGFSSFTATSYGLVLITFATGGANAFLLGLFGGCGLMIGDSLFYFLGTKGRKASSGKIKEYEEKLTKWFKEKPKWFTPVLIYVYIGLTPLPNDILTLSVSLSGYPYKKAFLPLLLGEITLVTLVALLAQFGYSLII